jgi:hypothetical protein
LLRRAKSVSCADISLASRTRVGSHDHDHPFRERFEEDPTSHPFLATAGANLEGRFSPDGKWVAYTSAESGLTQVFVRAFPTGDARVQVSANGREQPVWSPDGRSLYYANSQGSLLIRARMSLSPAFVVASGDTVLRGGYDIP